MQRLWIVPTSRLLHQPTTTPTITIEMGGILHLCKQLPTMIIASRMCPLVGQDECIYIYLWLLYIQNTQITRQPATQPRIRRLQDSQLRSHVSCESCHAVARQVVGRHADAGRQDCTVHCNGQTCSNIHALAVRQDSDDDP